MVSESSDVRSRLGSSTGDDSLEEGIARVARNGAGVVELACQHPWNHPGLIPAERARALRAQLVELDVQAVVHTDSAVNTAELHPGVRDAVRRHMDGYLELCRDVGSTRLIVHGGLSFGDDQDRAVAASVDMLSAWAADAASIGVVLVLENMNVLPPEAEIRYLACTAADVRHVIDAVDSPALRACADLGHAHLLPGGVPAFTAELDGLIGHVQINDNHGTIDRHLPLGEGTLDLAASLAALGRAGYRGPLAVELDGVAARETSVATLAEALRTFHAA